MNMPRFSTPRFVLRELSTSDEEQLFLLRSDELVLQFIDRPKANSIDDVRQFIEKILANKAVYWAIEFNGLLIGTICLWNISLETTSGEIGYDLLPKYHGQGVMQEVIPVVLRYGFEVLKLRRIGASVHSGNVKSVRLVEKFGFVSEPHPEEGNTDLYFCLRK